VGTVGGRAGSKRALTPTSFVAPVAAPRSARDLGAAREPASHAAARRRDPCRRARSGLGPGESFRRLSTTCADCCAPVPGLRSSDGTVPAPMPTTARLGFQAALQVGDRRHLWHSCARHGGRRAVPPPAVCANSDTATPPSTPPTLTVVAAEMEERTRTPGSTDRSPYGWRGSGARSLSTPTSCSGFTQVPADCSHSTRPPLTRPPSPRVRVLRKNWLARRRPDRL
jgi:hypothetical protein